MADRSTSSCIASDDRIDAGSCSQRRVEPSTSVKRKVAVPDGRTTDAYVVGHRLGRRVLAVRADDVHEERLENVLPTGTYVGTKTSVRGRRETAAHERGTRWETTEMGSPLTSYAKSGSVHIAYQVVGDGPGDLVYVPSAFGHLETFWEEPAVERFLHGLASFARLIIFDERGTGMSDRTNGEPTLEERADDIRAVMDEVGSERAALFGMSDGGVIAAEFAATIRSGYLTFIAMGSGPGTYVAPEIAEQVIADVVRHWGDGEIIEKARRVSPMWRRPGHGRFAPAPLCFARRDGRVDPDEHDVQRPPGSRW